MIIGKPITVRCLSAKMLALFLMKDCLLVGATPSYRISPFPSVWCPLLSYLTGNMANFEGICTLGVMNQWSLFTARMV